VLTTFEKASSLLNSAIITPVLGGLYTGRNVENRTMVFDKKLNHLGTYNTVNNFSWGYMGDQVVYDFDGDETFDIAEEGYALISVKNDAILLSKVTESEKTYDGEQSPTKVTTTEYFFYNGDEIERIATSTTDMEEEKLGALIIEWSDAMSFAVVVTDKLTKDIENLKVYACDGSVLIEKTADLEKENGDRIVGVAVIPLNKTNRSLVAINKNVWNESLKTYQIESEYYLLEND
jgi:hypothetical protein